MGVDFQTNVVIGKTVTIDELMNEEGYDAVLVATGAGLPKFLGVPGEHLNGVYSANEFLTRVNLMRANEFPEYDEPVFDCRGKDIAVVGGGNTAMDAVRTACRLGAKTSYLIYRRSEAEMPARAEEVKHAKEEGITFLCLTNPVAFLGEQGRLRRGGPVRQDGAGRARRLGPALAGRRSRARSSSCRSRWPIIALGTEANPLVQSTTPDLQDQPQGLHRRRPRDAADLEAGRLRRRRHRHRRRHRDPRHGRRPQGRRVDRRVPEHRRVGRSAELNAISGFPRDLRAGWVQPTTVCNASRGGLRETMSRSTHPTTAPPAEPRQRSTHPHSRKSSSLRRCMIATKVSRSCSVRMQQGCSLDVLAELAPGDDEGNAGRAGIAGQPAATLDKVSLVLPGHPGQLDHEDPGPDPVDKPEVAHLDCSTVAHRRRKDLPAGSMTFPLQSKASCSCRSASAWSATGRLPRSRPASHIGGAGETAGLP